MLEGSYPSVAGIVVSPVPLYFLMMMLMMAPLYVEVPPPCLCNVLFLTLARAMR